MGEHDVRQAGLAPGDEAHGSEQTRPDMRLPNVHLLTRAAGPGRVTHVLVAVGARWEDAARVEAPGGPGSVAELTRVLPAWGESAVEVFATDSRGCLLFIGVRFVNRARDEVEDLLRELCDVAFSEKGSLLQVASWLSASVGAPLFESECSVVEVGVVDAWKSVGAITLPPIPGRRRAEAEAALLAAAGRLPAPPDRVIAVEFACSAPVPHWVAVEIGRSSAGGEFVPSGSVRVAARYLADLGGS